jgi:hypothetical protein
MMKYVISAIAVSALATAIPAHAQPTDPCGSNYTGGWGGGQSCGEWPGGAKWMDISAPFFQYHGWGCPGSPPRLYWNPQVPC